MKWLEALKKSLTKSKEYGDKTYSNALKGNVSGAIVSMDDVSPLEHKIPVRLESENLIPYPYTPYSYESNGITYTDNGDGSVTANGTATADSYYALQRQAYGVKLNAGETITLTGCPSGGSNTTYSLRLDDAKTFIRDNGNGKTYTIMESSAFSVQICIGVDTTVENLTFYPKLQKGTKATPWTPFVPNDTAVTVKSLGKNFFDGVWQAGILNGGTGAHMDSASGYIHSVNYIPVVYGREYKFSNSVDNSSNTLVYEYDEDFNYILTTNIIVTPDKSYTPSKETAKFIRFRFNSKTLPIDTQAQIEIGSTATAYEPYKEGETITTTLAEGAELTSIAPNMTITTDTSGVVIDTEYNKDSNIVIEKLTQAIISMGGIV